MNAQTLARPCITCRHFRPRYYHPRLAVPPLPARCVHPRAERPAHDYVYGVIRMHYLEPDTMRDRTNLCGALGKLWEPQPEVHSEPSRWETAMRHLFGAGKERGP